MKHILSPSLAEHWQSTAGIFLLHRKHLPGFNFRRSLTKSFHLRCHLHRQPWNTDTSHWSKCPKHQKQNFHPLTHTLRSHKCLTHSCQRSIQVGFQKYVLIFFWRGFILPPHSQKSQSIPALFSLAPSQPHPSAVNNLEISTTLSNTGQKCFGFSVCWNLGFLSPFLYSFSYHDKGRKTIKAGITH